MEPDPRDPGPGGRDQRPDDSDSTSGPRFDQASAQRVVDAVRAFPWQGFLLRGFRSDLSREQLVEGESEQLGDRITITAARTYLTWRRSALWIAGASLSLAALLGLAGWIEALDLSSGDLGPGVPMSDTLLGSMKLLETLLFGAVVVSAVFAIRAARAWSDSRSSRKEARNGFLIGLGVPLICALIPWSSLGDDGPAAQFFGLIIAVALFAKVGPAIVGLCAGVIRASITLKTLLPESYLPGWVIAAFAPVYALLMVTVVLLVAQTSGSIVLLLGIAALIASPMSYLVASRDVLQPMSPEQASSSIGMARSRSTAFFVLGGVLIILWTWINDMLTLLTGFSFVASAVGNSFLIATVAADLQLQMIGRTWKQLDEFQGSEMAATLDRKLGDLEAAELL